MKATARVLGFALVTALASAAPPVTAQVWTAEGPAPIDDASGLPLGVDYGTGATQAVACHPTDPDIVYVATVNGGIWRTDNATAASPTWVAQTLDKPSGSMSVLDLDPLDATGQTAIAGYGRTSSYMNTGLDLDGVLYTTDGGTTWSYVNGPGDMLKDIFISGVEARGSILLVSSTGSSCSSNGAFRSTDSGATWTQLNVANSGLPNGSNDVMEGDPNNPAVLYSAVNARASTCDTGSNGVYKSTDTGATWSKISTAAMDTLLVDDDTKSDIKISASIADTPYQGLFVSFIPCPGGTCAYDSAHHSTDGGGTWQAMDGPAYMDGFSAGRKFFALQADATDPDVVYLGSTTPRLRGDAGEAPQSQWQTFRQGNTANGTKPHADLRDFAFRADGVMVEVDDGGVFGRTGLATDWTQGDWIAMSGDLHVVEGYHGAYDPHSDIFFIGTQDNGTIEGLIPGDWLWSVMSGGDGGDVSVDLANLELYDPGGGAVEVSNRYRCYQNLGGFRRERRDASNNDLGTVNPAMTVVSGNPDPKWGWLNPHEVNRVDGTRLILAHYGDSDDDPVMPPGVYESLDRAETLTEIATDVYINKDAIAYGAAGNPDVLYIGGDDGVWVRTAAHPSPLTLTLSLSGIRDVEVDPDDPTHAFVVSSDAVHRTTASGGSWNEVTGNLNSFDHDGIRAVSFLPDPAYDFLLVGTKGGGVLWSRELSGFTDWSQAGTGLPPMADVYDMDKGVARREVWVTAMGNGTWSMTVPETNWPPSAQNDTFWIAVNEPNGNPVGTVQATDPENGDLSYTVTTGNTGSAFAIDSGTGEITVNDSTQLVNAPFSLSVEATDDGAPPESDSATITVNTTAALEWTATGDGVSIYQEANWNDFSTGSQPPAGTVNPSTDIDRVMSVGFGVLGGGDGGSPHFQLGEFGSLSITGATVWRMDPGQNAGIRARDAALGDVPNRPLTVADTAELLTHNMNDIDLAASGSARVTIYGGAEPLARASTVTMTGYDVTINFLAETPTDFAAEHASKFTVNGSPAELGADPAVWELGDNLVAASDGAAGCIVTAHANGWADLAISKTDGVDSATPGHSLTYTIVASNYGPTDDPAVSLVDSFPADLSCSWTSVAAGGATGNNNASGDISETLDMPVGSSVTYTTICIIDPAATGTLSNTATVATSLADPTPGNDTATDSDTVLEPEADLEINKGDGVTSAVPGGSITYTIVALNVVGPSDAPSVSVTDTFPADLSCSWISVAFGGATGNSNGSGDISDTLDMPAGSHVVYTASCDIDPAATGTLSNTATVSSSVTDPTPGNNSATDDDTVLMPEADLAITKDDGVRGTEPGDTLTYTIQVSNAGPSDVVDAQVEDQFPAELTGCQWTCVPGGGASCTAGPVAGDIDDLADLPAASSVTYTAECTVDPGASFEWFTNTATVTPPAGAVDPDPGNNSASDTDLAALIFEDSFESGDTTAWSATAGGAKRLAEVPVRWPTPFSSTVVAQGHE